MSAPQDEDDGNLYAEQAFPNRPKVAGNYRSNVMCGGISVECHVRRNETFQMFKP